MNIETKEKTLNPVKSLVIGIVMALIGLGLIITAYALNMDKSKEWYIYVLYIIGAFIFLASTGEFRFYMQNVCVCKKMDIKQMCVIGVFSALSIVLYYFGKFNLPFFPSWLDIQFSDVPALLTSFMYGPMSGCLVILIRFFCKLPATITVGVGELADLLIGVTLCSIAGIIYYGVDVKSKKGGYIHYIKGHKTIKGALCAMGVGMACATVVACLANWLILIPAYVNIAGFPWGALVGGMNSYMNGVVTEENFMLYYIFIGVLPFNLFRYLLVFVITLLLYKRLHILIEHITGTYQKEEVTVSEENAEPETSVTKAGEENAAPVTDEALKENE